jgi:hypothetical protein
MHLRELMASTLADNIGPLGALCFVDVHKEKLAKKDFSVEDALDRYANLFNARPPPPPANVMPGTAGMPIRPQHVPSQQSLVPSSPPIRAATNGFQSGPTSPVSLKRKAPPRTPTPGVDPSSDAVAVASPHLNGGDHLARHPSPAKRANFGGSPQLEPKSPGRNRSRTRVN